MSKEKFLVEATIKVKYFVWGENETEECLRLLEEGELEVMMAKDMANVMYTDNQSCRFEDVDIEELKVTKIRRNYKLIRKTRR